ncbi:MAG: MFS transporter [Verrucomicrobiae bacterium]|nr:MFS transporter [Verrucomicrobiae bacterium]NNJ41936.1 MFS transporter [Akkermansiaceae bacterium]
MSGIRSKLGKGGVWWIAVGFFLLSLAPGLWMPSLPNVLHARGIEWVLPYAFAVGPLAALFSPLIFGSMADYRFSAQKLAGTLSLVGAGFLGMAFVALQMNWGPWAYLGFQSLNALIAAPMWALLSTVTLASVDGAQKKFPLFRVWGTVGWIMAGLMVSFLDWDSSPRAGMAAAGVRVLFGLVCFMMPETKPQGKPEQGKPGWRKYFGLDALVLFKDPALRVFLLTSVCFAVPLAAFYMYAPIQLKELGDGHPTASMALGQVTEIGAMLMLAGLLAKGRLRWVLIAALSLGVARYGLFAYSGWTGSLPWLWLGIALHGPCYTFYFVTGQMLVDRRVAPGMRSQAQALLGTMVGGIGGLLGSLLCGWYYGVTIDLVNGWVFFWGGLMVAVFGCAVYFINGYGRAPNGGA